MGAPGLGLDVLCSHRGIPEGLIVSLLPPFYVTSSRETPEDAGEEVGKVLSSGGPGGETGTRFDH